MFFFSTIININNRKYNVPPLQSLFFIMIKEGQIEFSKKSKVPTCSTRYIMNILEQRTWNYTTILIETILLSEI